MHMTFDTLGMVKRLEAKGLKREQAEELVSVVKDAQDDLATKNDLRELELRMTVKLGVLMFTLLLGFKILDKFL